ncbi:MAG: serine/threonine-protein kinase, partial [Myxococcota bacterium]
MTPAIDSIHCPACGQNNRPGRRFCAQCGVRFDRLCAACGERNEPDERFCGQCGTALEAGAPLPSPAGAREAPPPRLGPTASVQTPTETPSSVANGRYHLERFLGEGAKKRVFLAQDNRLNRQVAIAIVKSDGLDATGLARVRREAEAMGRLGDHANVVTVFDVEEEHDHVFIVSRYVAGGDVQGHLHNAPDHRLPLSNALSIATDVARALQHAHEHDIVHRDVKPGNIWLTEDGSALLGDFGLAALSDLPRLTQEGTMLGTVAYMPPEQALGRKADARSDLYSLGATLYEMVA